MELRFGSYRLKVRDRQLTGPNGAIEIDGRSVDVLRALLHKPNELVLKDEIFSAVWQGAAVGENTLQVHISALRKVLGAEVIETVHGRGYKYRGAEPEAFSETVTAGNRNSDRPAIAVLAFRNVDEERDLKSFCEAMTGDLIEQLSRFTLLSTMSERRVPGTDAQETEGGADADFLLAGEVRRSGTRIRIAAKLQDARTGVVIWAEHYDRSLDDFFAVIDELSGIMAGRINTRIESHMVTRQVSGRVLTSYDHLIKGIWHFRSQKPDGPMVAEQLFRKARELNPGNAEAIRWLSLKHTCCWLSGRQREHLVEGLALGRQAAELDSASATCHAAHGLAQLWAEGAEIAAASFRKAYAANSNDGYMLADVGLCHIYCGRVEEGYAVLDRAEQLNPFPSDWHSQYRSIGRFAEGRYAEAIPGLHRLPLGAHGLTYLMACHGHLGNRSAIDALAPKLDAVNCDLTAAALDEPFIDPGVRDRLVDGIHKASALVS